MNSRDHSKLVTLQDKDASRGNTSEGRSDGDCASGPSPNGDIASTRSSGASTSSGIRTNLSAEEEDQSIISIEGRSSINLFDNVLGGNE